MCWDKSIKTIVIRVDSSILIGIGHLMRCMTLAERLRKVGHVYFISRDLAGNLNHVIVSNGYQIFQLPQAEPDACLAGYQKWLTVKPEVDAVQTRDILLGIDTDLLIVDHYAIDEQWEKCVRPYVNKIMVIDDLANRKHECDLLLDQNYYFALETRYEKLVPLKCQLLLGPRNVLLREEFYELRGQLRRHSGQVRQILIFFGGSDAVNMTLRTLRTLRTIVDIGRTDVKVHVVVGESNVNRADIQSYCEKNHMEYYCQINYMARLMCASDLAIGAGGTTIWERSFLGLPSIVVAIADNQVQMSKACASLGIIEYVGKAEEVGDSRIKNVIAEFLREPERVLQMSERALDFWKSSNCDHITQAIMAEI